MTNTLEKLKIYKENGEFILEQINRFNHSTKHSFITENELLEAFDQYQNVLQNYEILIEQGQDLIGLITRHLAKKTLH